MLALTLELERGAVATVQVVWQRADLPRTYELDVIGDGARVEGVLDPEFRATRARRRRAGRPADDGAPSVRGMRALPGRRARRRSRPRWPARPAEATASLATALACEQALKSGGRVTS